MKRILVAYATKNGAAREAAEQIAEQTLIKWGDEKPQIDVKDLAKDRIGSLEAYDNIVLGTSVYMGQARKPFKAFLTANEKALTARPNAPILFLCGATAEGDARDALAVQVFTESLLKKAGRYYHVGHVYDFQKMNWFERMIMKKMLGNTENQIALKPDVISEIASRLK